MKAEWRDSWTREKSTNIVQRIAELVDELLREKPYAEDVLSFLAPIAYDATKIWAEYHGAEWDYQDSETLLSKGTVGYEELSAKYGLIEETKVARQLRLASEVYSNIRLLLDGPRSPNRTLINEQLDMLIAQDKYAVRLSALLDKVNLGEVVWGAFQQKASEILDQRYHDEAETTEP